MAPVVKVIFIGLFGFVFDENQIFRHVAVKYTAREEWCLPLPIPLHLATNITEVREYEARLAEAESKGQKL